MLSPMLRRQHVGKKFAVFSDIAVLRFDEERPRDGHGLGALADGGRHMKMWLYLAPVIDADLGGTCRGRLGLRLGGYWWIRLVRLEGGGGSRAAGPMLAGEPVV